jgi:tRNA-2-methylthio-N6-dimethylallyladenosine synthase
MQDLSSQDLKDPNAHDGESNAMPDAPNPGARVFIETYGCQMNLADSELMGGILRKQGFSRADSLADADVILINTCAVREKAEERVFGRLTHLHQYKVANPDLVIGVTGCMAEHLKSAIVERAPYVDLVVGPDAYRRLPELLHRQLQDETDPLIDVRLDKRETYDGISPVRSQGTNGWITVQRGCDKFCTFCIVPFTRGRERGVPPAEIIRQAQEIAAQGFAEVTLLGQTVNSYRWEDWDFADLLEALVQIDGIERIRFTSPYPIDFTDKLIACMASHEKICKYLHLPVQSGSDPVLQRMRRGYSRADYDTLVTKIRDAMPQCAISTDVIVGFPGETDHDFEATMELVRSVRYDFSYLFKYSQRSGTLAARSIPDDIPEPIKSQRLSQIIALQEAISAEVFASKIGSEQTLLVEGPSRRDPSEWCGRTDDFKMTVFPKPDDLTLLPGQLVRVRINECTSHTLRSVLI